MSLLNLFLLMSGVYSRPVVTVILPMTLTLVVAFAFAGRKCATRWSSSPNARRDGTHVRGGAASGG
ncbi:hypothetical protein BIV23_38580 [Streptomyces monashensis]|uniref:Uncharacterized protein n=1 Tax=Streptomyces monashensis TaxID=1678012 RepID=A0A1S2PF85_9ACTN|nr:hypothetical protein BIV23_38580 [Streptomyces monashensis]